LACISNNPSDPLAQIAVVIAAGGEGTRIGGAKPDQPLGGLRLIDHAISWARRHGDKVALAVQDPSTDWGSNLPLLIDRQPDFGPISALASAFRFAVQQERTGLLLIGCDLPFLPEDLLARLYAAGRGQGVVIPTSHGRDHPMAALWRPDIAALGNYIDQGGRSLWGFSKIVGSALVEWPCGADDDPFANINDHAALKVAESRLKMRDYQSFP
jgi:molybdenum cofactor guanylyltransferase